MKHHIECSESRSWFNNNQSHYFRQFLSVTCRLEGGELPIRGHSLCIPHHNQYYVVFTNLQTAPSFSFHLPAHSASSWQGMFFIYIFVISHEFVLAFKKTLWFFPWLLTGIPLILFLSQSWSKGCFILKQMTRELILVYTFINFVIPLPATNTRHSQDNCWNL